MSVVFSLDQVLACTESAVSEYSTMSQCLSALLGRPGRVTFIPNGLRWEKKTSAPITPIQPLPGAPLGVINTAATRGGNGSHSRGGGGLVRKDTSPVKKTRRRKPSGSRSQVPPMANHDTKLGVQTLTPRHTSRRAIVAS